MNIYRSRNYSENIYIYRKRDYTFFFTFKNIIQEIKATYFIITYIAQTSLYNYCSLGKNVLFIFMSILAWHW